MKKPLEDYPDGFPCTEEHFKYTCRYCGTAFADKCHPDSDFDPICSRCYRGEGRIPPRYLVMMETPDG